MKKNVIVLLFAMFVNSHAIAQDYSISDLDSVRFMRYYKAIKNPDNVYKLEVSYLDSIYLARKFNFENLVWLRIDDLDSIPGSLNLDKCKKLKRIDISYSRNLEISSICKLQSIEKLILYQCGIEFSDSIFMLNNLEEIVLEECTIKNMPQNFGEMSCLKRLTIRSCRLAELPKSFGELKNLEYLNISDNHFDNINSECEKISKLKTLKTLIFAYNSDKYCYNWFRDLCNLEFLDLSYSSVNYCHNLDTSNYSFCGVINDDKLKVLHLNNLNQVWYFIQDRYRINRNITLEVLSVENNDYFSLSLLEPFVGLCELHADNCDIDQWYDSCFDLSKMRLISLYNNNITEIPLSIFELRNCTINLALNPINNIDIDFNDKSIIISKNDDLNEQYPSIIDLYSVFFSSNNLTIYLDEIQLETIRLRSNHKVESRALQDSINILKTIRNEFRNEVLRLGDSVSVSRKMAVVNLSRLNKAKKELEINRVKLHGITFYSAIALVLFIIIITIGILFLYAILRKGRKIRKRLNIEIDDNEQKRIAVIERDEKIRELKETKEVLEIRNIEIEKARDDYAESQKRAFIGNLVVGMVHDLKNSLYRIGGYTGLNDDEIRDLQIAMVKEKEELDKFNGHFQQMVERNKSVINDIQKVEEWIEAFLPISRDQAINQQKEINLLDYLRSTLQTMEFEMRKKQISWMVEGDENIRIETYPGFISQIIQNLIKNAIEHGFNGDNREDRLIRIAAEKSGNDIVINVVNNGKPIEPQNIPRIFDEYFTTKPIVKNVSSGIGLSYIRKIIREILHGNISCTSDLEKGVTFTISFPIN